MALGPETEVLEAPRGKDIDAQMIIDLRRITQAGRIRTRRRSADTGRTSPRSRGRAVGRADLAVTRVPPTETKLFLTLAVCQAFSPAVADASTPPENADGRAKFRAARAGCTGNLAGPEGTVDANCTRIRRRQTGEDVALTCYQLVELPGIEPLQKNELTCGNTESDYAKQRETTCGYTESC